MMLEVVRVGILALFCILEEKLCFFFPPLTIMLATCLSYGLYKIEVCFLYTYSVREFLQKNLMLFLHQLRLSCGFGLTFY